MNWSRSPFLSNRTPASAIAAASTRELGRTHLETSSSFSSDSTVMRWSNSTSETSTRCSCAVGSHVIFFLVALKSPSRWVCPRTAATRPAASCSTASMTTLPQSMSVTSSPATMSCASSCSM
eukprot:Amastigsp_a846478_57.p5 type:complete len:122 gc:universal Amastigsp_a846478_57:1434-1069(-)